MNYYIVFAPRFLEWPVAICRELREIDENAAFSGLVTGERGVYDRVLKTGAIPEAQLDFLDAEERKWINAKYNAKRMHELEERLGPEVINRVIIADRHVGNAYVTGGLFPPTALLKACRDTNRTRAYVVGVLDYFLRRLEELKPDVVFCYTVAGGPALALAEICKALNIPFRRFMHTRIGSRMIIDHSIEGLTAPVTERFQRARAGEVQGLDVHLPAAMQYLTELRARETRPDYVEHARREFVEKQSFPKIFREFAAAIYHLIRGIVDHREITLRQITPLQRVLYRIPRLLGSRWQTITGRPFEKENYVPDSAYAYYPLHVEPEASTMVVAPHHTNQLAVIEALSKNIPPSMSLVVKEHFPMLGNRPKGFYKALKRMPKVILASPFASPLDLVNGAGMITCISGTAGLEALMMQKPLLVFGPAPYLGLDCGFVACQDLARLPQAFAEAMTTPPADDDTLLLYLKSLFDVSFDFSTALMWGNITQQTTVDHREVPQSIARKLYEVATAP